MYTTAAVSTINFRFSRSGMHVDKKVSCDGDLLNGITSIVNHFI